MSKRAERRAPLHCIPYLIVSYNEVGPSLAQAIIDYRAEHGAFETAEDLLNVKGIGEAKLEGFCAEITFTEEDGNENSGG